MHLLMNKSELIARCLNVLIARTLLQRICRAGVVMGRMLEKPHVEIVITIRSLADQFVEDCR